VVNVDVSVSTWFTDIAEYDGTCGKLLQARLGQLRDFRSVFDCIRAMVYKELLLVLNQWNHYMAIKLMHGHNSADL